METILIILLVIISLVLTVVILLQSGQGSGLAAGFGGASAGTQMFGGSGAGGFLLKVTVVLGALFMLISLMLAYLSSQPKSAMSLAGSGQVSRSQEDEIIKRGGGAGSGQIDEPVVIPADQPDLNDDDDAAGAAGAADAPDQEPAANEPATTEPAANEPAKTEPADKDQANPPQ